MQNQSLQSMLGSKNKPKAVKKAKKEFTIKGTQPGKVKHSNDKPRFFTFFLTAAPQRDERNSLGGNAGSSFGRSDSSSSSSGGSTGIKRKVGFGLADERRARDKAMMHTPRQDPQQVIAVIYITDYDCCRRPCRH